MVTEADPEPNLAFGDFVIDRADQRVLGPQGPVKLGNKAFQVLLLLAEQDGRLLTKDALFSSVWDGTIVTESALTSAVKELRRALGDESRTPLYIESVYGRGYRLLPEVREIGATTRERAARPASPARTAGASPTGKAPLLYVPAFDDSALRASQPHLGAVLHEEILLALSRFRELRLVSGAEAKPAAAGPASYGERDYQLTVTLIPDGASVRAFARITRLVSQAIIWVDNIELTAESVGTNIDLLVRRVAVAALPRLHDDVISNLPAQPEGAYDLYLLTKQKMRALETLAEAREVAAAWEGLIGSYPTFAQAYPPLIRLYHTDFSFTGLGSAGRKERRRAYELAHKAIAIDPTEAHLHTVKGWCHLWAGEAQLARQHLQEALGLNPYNQARLLEIATALMFLDDLKAAEELLDRRRELTPFAMEAPHLEQGLLHLLREEFSAAAEQLALARSRHPDDAAATRPTILGELYGLLAAAGSGSGDLADQAGKWRAAMVKDWASPEPPDDDHFKQWALFHNPFQNADRRQWLAGLLDSALAGSPGQR